MLRALIIRQQWLDKILSGKKTWEIRGSKTAIRGTIGLIESGSGKVVGLCEVVDCIGPLSANKFRVNCARAGMRPSQATLGWYRNTYAWVLSKPQRLNWPIHYKHPMGAVIWVTLDSRVERSVRLQAS